VIIFKLTIKEYREKQGLSQRQLAILAEISRSYLNEIEKGLKVPRLHVIEKIATALNVCMLFLIVPDNADSCNRCEKVCRSKSTS
jgi:transcriptional regulator with XRE-family HTH domain